MNAALLQFGQNSQGAVSEIHSLPGIHVGEAIIIEPPFRFVVVEHPVNNRSFNLTLAQFQAQFERRLCSRRASNLNATERALYS